ncbi:MAG: EamA family transporter [Sphingomonas bacterium]|jgi:drug/metabolite transporter (DMT)-like permease|uniref:DMT family transporter n=1 Tax=Sphingomonas bacterium TaxID=1895847 RepID=UPI00262F602C|nr:DMT family transporter [Sphingomonas bacterium]MDB5703999.1 EamA family transporter [Sphingomonas bacterium]
MHQSDAPRKTVVPQRHGAHPLAFAALIAANVMLAFGSWFVRMADTGPVASAFWRIALATPILLAIAVAGGWRPVRVGRTMWLLFALAGLCFAADLGSWHIGILKTTLANATLFGNSAILFFPVYGFLAMRAWPSRTQGIALALAAVGAALLMGRSYQLDPRHLVGDMLCLLAGLLYTFYFIFMARIRETMAPFPALAMATGGSIVPLLALALLMGDRIWPHDWTPILALVLVSQVIGQTLLIYALGQLSPLVVGIALLVQPVVAGAVGWIVYDERLGLADLVGAVLVAVALVLVREREPAMLAPADTEPR